MVVLGSILAQSSPGEGTQYIYWFSAFSSSQSFEFVLSYAVALPVIGAVLGLIGGLVGRSRFRRYVHG
jgi:hypothetical protein